jgi:hypothetical protein
MDYYGMGIYNNNTIISSIYTNSDIWYGNYLPTLQVYNTNVVDRSHLVMLVSSSHVNIYNSYSRTNMSWWNNHNVYITEHVSNIHNGFVPPYSLTELASHCTPQTHMPMSNCAIAELIWELQLISINRYILHRIELECRLHQIWFQNHMLRLACSIQLHLFIAE